MINRIGMAAVAAVALNSVAAQAGPLDEAARARVLAGVDAKSVEANGRAIWGFAETGYQEQKNAALLAKTLKDAGFEVTMGVAGEPTAFIAPFESAAGSTSWTPRSAASGGVRLRRGPRAMSRPRTSSICWSEQAIRPAMTWTP